MSSLQSGHPVTVSSGDKKNGAGANNAAAMTMTLDRLQQQPTARCKCRRCLVLFVVLALVLIMLLDGARLQQQIQQQNLLGNTADDRPFVSDHCPNNARGVKSIGGGGICHMLLDARGGSSSSFINSASSLWLSNLHQIWNASQIPSRPDYSNSEEARQILFSTFADRSMWRLRRGLKTRPGELQLRSLEKVIDIIDRRLVDDSAPPLNVAVMGGSVVAGRGCHRSERGLTNKVCAWPNRLELLVNQLAGREIIKVHNMGVGGVSTEQGITFVKYWMYPKQIQEKGPDVVINSYSTNDAVSPWGAESVQEATRSTLEGTRRKMQEFIRLLLFSKPCDLKSKTHPQPPPLILTVDDYLGSMQPNMVGEMAYSTALTEITSWYGITSISYPEVVRDIVLRDTSETTFSAHWKVKSKPDGRLGDFLVDGHFKETGHASLAWIIAYNLFEVTHNFCNDKRTATNNKDLQIQSTNDRNGVDEMATLSSTFEENIALVQMIPPPLEESLTLSNISERWRTNRHPNSTVVSRMEHYSHCDNHEQGGEENVDNNTTAVVQQAVNNPCEMAFIAGPIGLQNPGRLYQFLRPYLSENEGWGSKTDKEHGYKYKVGWEALNGVGSTFSLRLEHLQSHIGVITIMYMKSYGDTWANSTAQVTVEYDEETSSTTRGDNAANNNFRRQVQTQNLTGYHDSPTSISYTEKMILTHDDGEAGWNSRIGGAAKGTDLTLRVTLGKINEMCTNLLLDNEQKDATCSAMAQTVFLYL